METKLIPRYGTVNFERRKHPRFSLDLPVEYWKIGNGKPYPARTADISEGGLLLYVSDEIEIGQNLGLKLFFDSGPKLITINAEVQIVWKDFSLGKTGHYRVGVKFVHISVEDMEKLKEYLNTLMNSKIPKSNVPPKLVSNLGITILGDCASLPTKSFSED